MAFPRHIRAGGATRGESLTLIGRAAIKTPTAMSIPSCRSGALPRPCAAPACRAGSLRSGHVTARKLEPVRIAFAGSFPHIYAPGTQRSIRHARAGAEVAEIAGALRVGVAPGASAAHRAVPHHGADVQQAGTGGDRT